MPIVTTLVTNRKKRIHAAMDALGFPMTSMDRNGTHSQGQLHLFESDVMSQDYVSIVDPTTQETIRTVAYVNDWESLIQTAQWAQKKWAKWPAVKRLAVLEKCAAALKKKQDDIATLITAEVGKTTAEARGEVQEVIDVFHKLTDLVEQAGGERPYYYHEAMSNEPGRDGYRVYQQRRPHDIVCIVPAFNFPVAVPGWGLAPALLAGCAILVAPSPRAPLAMMGQAMVLQSVLKRYELVGLITVMLLKNETKLALVQDDRVGCVQFTGSVAMGKLYKKQIHNQCFYKDVILELGGNNVVVVDAFSTKNTTYLEKVVQDVAFGSVGTAGQRCTTTRRLFVHEAIADCVQSALVSFYQTRLIIGDPFDDTVTVQPLISSEAVHVMKTYIAALCRAGGQLLVGGDAVDMPGNFVEPAIVSAPISELVREEHFVPVLVIHRFSDVRDVVQEINKTQYGLSLGIYGESRCFDYIRGTVRIGIVNQYVGTSGAEAGYDNVFGGHGLTGGKPGMLGPYAIETYCQPVTNGVIGTQEPTVNAQGVAFPKCHKD